ncbi:unnamed protein product [Nyctereutes procyonoides]|uniref:(raccoon dog) hypothetical protein n=1 Tax=Nyctereutes procyonoides TaxID=34880 RepID=A0A811Z546_NYCPR|nr:unnamed protein product [Nyctereutes procyonoides]
MTFATKSSHQNLIIFLNKVQTTIIGYKGCDLFAVLDQLDPDALPDGRIWLFGFNPHLLQHDSLRVGSAPEGVGLQRRAQGGLLVLLIMPLLVPPVAAELPGGTEAATLAHPAGATGLSERVFLFVFCFFFENCLYSISSWKN